MKFSTLAIHETGLGVALSALMKTVIIVSKCIRVIKSNQTQTWYQFHFNGVCAGEALRKVLLKARQDFLIRKDEEYLMYVRMISCEEGTFRGEVLKLKLLSECWDRS